MLGALKQAKQLASKALLPRRQLPAPWHSIGLFSTGSSLEKRVSLKLEEVQKVLSDVKADDVRVINVRGQCDWTDHIVIATGRSSWHVKNIAQALIYKVKQKQKGADRMFLPSVEGQEGGKWVVIDSGTVIIHALDEKARAYYDLESHWAKERTPKGSVQGLDSGRTIGNAKECSGIYILNDCCYLQEQLKRQLVDLDKAFVKIRPKNNSKKKPATNAE